MHVIICANPEEVGQQAAARTANICRAAGSQPVLGVATGSSPLATYSALARWVEAGRLDLSQAHAFALDEYVGLPSEHPQSYATVIDATVTRPLRLNPANVHVPPGQAEDIEAACADYERTIQAVGAVDVQVLGVGTNGHIGFNEPTSSLGSRTRIKTLTAYYKDVFAGMPAWQRDPALAI